MGRVSAIGLVLGGFAFVLAAVLALAGPFEPIGLEKVLAERASTVLDSLRALWRGETPSPSAAAPWTVDRWLGVGSVALAAASLVFAAVGFARGEPPRAVLAVVGLGAGAIGFSEPLGALAIVGTAALLLVLEHRLVRGRAA